VSESVLQAGVTVDITRKLETVLDSMGASGKGLHERFSSIESRLPVGLMKQLRYIAAVRNKLSHYDVVLPAGEFESFRTGAARALLELQDLAQAQAQLQPRNYSIAPPLKPLAPRPRRIPWQVGVLICLVAFIVYLDYGWFRKTQQPSQSSQTEPGQVNADATTGKSSRDGAVTGTPHNIKKHNRSHTHTPPTARPVASFQDARASGGNAAATDGVGKTEVPLDAVRNLPQGINQ
jgi:hypothetical protein